MWSNSFINLAVGLSSCSRSATLNTKTAFRSCKFFFFLCKWRKKKNCMFTFMLILKTYIQKPLSLLKSKRPVILYRSTKDYKEVSDIKVKATSNTRRLIANISFTLLEQLTVLKKQIATSSYNLLMIWVFNDCAIQLTAMWKWVSSVWSSCQFLKNQIY